MFLIFFFSFFPSHIFVLFVLAFPFTTTTTTSLSISLFHSHSLSHTLSLISIHTTQNNVFSLGAHRLVLSDCTVRPMQNRGHRSGAEDHPRARHHHWCHSSQWYCVEKWMVGWGGVWTYGTWHLCSFFFSDSKNPTLFTHAGPFWQDKCVSMTASFFVLWTARSIHGSALYFSLLPSPNSVSFNPIRGHVSSLQWSESRSLLQIWKVLFRVHPLLWPSLYLLDLIVSSFLVFGVISYDFFVSFLLFLFLFWLFLKNEFLNFFNENSVFYFMWYDMIYIKRHPSDQNRSYRRAE